MKRIILISVVLATLVSRMLCHSEEIRIVTFSEDPWPPYTYGESGKEPTGGIAVEFVQEIFKRINIPTHLMLYPWKRCLLQMKDGTRDALMLCGKMRIGKSICFTPTA